MKDISNLSERAQFDYWLIQKAMSGDESAYEDLFLRYKDAVYYMLVRMIGNHADVEDLTFEAFAKAFKKIDRYSSKFAFSTWLFKIASNNCIDFIRKKKGIVVSLDLMNEETNSPVINLKSDNLNPEQTFIRNQKHEIMRKHVTHLKDRYRKLIELRYFREYSYDEIVQEMGIPLGTVKAQLFRAKYLLFEKLRHSEVGKDKRSEKNVK